MKMSPGRNLRIVVKRSRIHVASQPLKDSKWNELKNKILLVGKMQDDLLLSFWDETLHQPSLLLPVLLPTRPWQDIFFLFFRLFIKNLQKCYSLSLGKNANSSKLCKFMTTIWEPSSKMSMIVLLVFCTFWFTCRTSGTLNIHARGAHDLQKLKPGSKDVKLSVLSQQR